MKSLFLFPLVALGSVALPSPKGTTPPLRPTHAAPDSTAVRVIHGADEPEVNEVLTSVLHVEKQRLSIHDPRLAGRLFHITYQEYRQGKAEPERELTSQFARLLQFDSTGAFTCTVYSRRAAETKVENRFLLPQGMVIKAFTADPKRADQYSLRPDIHRLYRAADQAGRPANSPASEIHLPLGRKVPLVVYTLPYESDGLLLYCNLAQSRVPVGEWYGRFHIPHFVVYYVQIEPEKTQVAK